VKARQTFAEKEARARSEAAPVFQLTAVDPREKVAVPAARVFHLDEQVAGPARDRARDVEPRPAQVVPEHLKELQLGADVRGASVPRPVDSKSETGATFLSDFEDGVVDQPDRPNRRNVDVVLRERRPCQRLKFGVDVR
jgi:hypothetical protein